MDLGRCANTCPCSTLRRGESEDGCRSIDSYGLEHECMICGLHLVSQESKMIVMHQSCESSDILTSLPVVIHRIIVIQNLHEYACDTQQAPHRTKFLFADLTELCMHACLGTYRFKDELHYTSSRSALFWHDACVKKAEPAFFDITQLLLAVDLRNSDTTSDPQ